VSRMAGPPLGYSVETAVADRAIRSTLHQEIHVTSPVLPSGPVQGSGTVVVVPDIRIHARVQESPDRFDLAAQQMT